MDLTELLTKTKTRAGGVKTSKSPVLIATEDRPYNFKSKATGILDSQIVAPKLTKAITFADYTDPTQHTPNTLTDIFSDKSLFCHLLYGLQKKTLFLLFKECQNHKGRYITPPLALDYIASKALASKGTIKTTIQRLATKGLLIRTGFKNGRGGWTRYEISEETYEFLNTLNIEKKEGVL